MSLNIKDPTAPLGITFERACSEPGASFATSVRAPPQKEIDQALKAYLRERYSF
ncbi:MAG: hypothetical protein ABI629_21595 [bacterium]